VLLFCCGAVLLWGCDAVMLFCCDAVFGLLILFSLSQNAIIYQNFSILEGLDVYRSCPSFAIRPLRSRIVAMWVVSINI